MNINTPEENTKIQILTNFLVKNKKKIIFIILILIISFLLVIFLNEKEKKLNIAISENYLRAKIMIENDNKVLAKDLLIDVIKKKNKFYSPLSLNLLIEKELEKNNQNMEEYFNIILSIKKIDEENINLIKIKKALYFIEQGEQKILEILKPIVNSNSIWKNKAINLLRDYHLNKGEINKAEEYSKLLK